MSERKPYVPANVAKALHHAASSALAGGAGGDFNQRDLDQIDKAVDWLSNTRTTKPALLDLTPSEIEALIGALDTVRDYYSEDARRNWGISKKEAVSFGSVYQKVQDLKRNSRYKAATPPSGDVQP
jgi:hypothetical protein